MQNAGSITHRLHRRDSAVGRESAQENASVASGHDLERSESRCWRPGIVGLAILALTASTSLWAQSDTDTRRSTASVEQRFDTLDRDGNGRLSREEFAADDTLASYYESFATGATIEAQARESGRQGVSLDQFRAGMEAMNRSGSMGPAASGGERRWVYPDGSVETVEGSGIQTD